MILEVPIRYNVTTDVKTTIVDLQSETGCTEGMTSGNDVQMMSWDSDVFTFRCGNTAVWAYRISTGAIQEITVSDVSYTAPMPFPSGQRFFHGGNIYNQEGAFLLSLNGSSGGEHLCIGKNASGQDYYFAIAFAESPDGGC